MVAVDGKPVAASHRHIVADAKPVPVLDKMHVLYAETITTPQYGAGIVRLVHILQHNPQMPRALREHFMEAHLPAFRHKL
jgi:hypothetical protein